MHWGIVIKKLSKKENDGSMKQETRTGMTNQKKTSKKIVRILNALTWVGILQNPVYSVNGEKLFEYENQRTIRP